MSAVQNPTKNLKRKYVELDNKDNHNKTMPNLSKSSKPTSLSSSSPTPISYSAIPTTPQRSLSNNNVSQQTKNQNNFDTNSNASENDNDRSSSSKSTINVNKPSLIATNPSYNYNDIRNDNLSNHINFNDSMNHSDVYLYQNLPTDVNINETSFKRPFEDLANKISNEFKNLNISTLVQEYELILSEFLELSRPFRMSNPKYNAIFEHLIDTLKMIYNININVMYVNMYKYTTSEWGNLYWKFLHLTSILLSHAFEWRHITSFLNFATIVYNIDLILPCSMCANHYRQIKYEDSIKGVIKTIAFGSVMTGLQTFHNIITSNVDKTAEYRHRPKREPFYVANFAERYHCINVVDESLQKSSSYIKSNIDWQPTTHTLITIILSTYLSQSYTRVSSLLKRIAYKNESIFEDVDFGEQYPPTMMYQQQDFYFANLTKLQILYCLKNALLLQFQDTNVTPEDITNNSIFNQAILKFYNENAPIVQKLLEINNVSDNSIAQSSYNYIYTQLSNIKNEASKQFDLNNDDI